MVFYKQSALDDLEELFVSLLSWQTENYQRILDLPFVVQYRDDIKSVCDSLDKESYNRKAVYRLHKEFGKYIYQYKRNNRTSWYIIYNKLGNDVYIEKIINNYKTL